MPSNGQSKKPNRLIKETSPYLLQHAYNPVDWHSWNTDAFLKAKKQDKPIFLSIGYSTCHWCHVMAHESFEDLEVAKMMNETFISIKVDREERPDIDKIYMDICQMITGRGGWPLTIIMTPDKKPFFAGTYIPKLSRFGRMGIIDLIQKVKELWATNRNKLLDSAEEIVSAASAPQSQQADDLTIEIADQAYQQLEGSFDPTYGGFGRAPKFPTPHSLSFLLRYGNRTHSEKAISMVEKTLTEMRKGGIFDHIGYGFHRYSTDEKWFLPHFEKMLYDQAMLITAYTELYLITKEPRYKEVVEEIFTYVTRDLQSPDGVFFSAEDADSEGEEGKFYTWRFDEIKSLIPSQDFDDYSRIFHILPQGNYQEESTGEPTGKNILYFDTSIPEYAEEANQDPSILQGKLDSIRKTLLQNRNQRIRPMRDYKVLTDWNGLLIAALAKAGLALKKAEYIQAAKKAADFILKTMFEDREILYHQYSKNIRAIPGFLNDYAFFTWGLFELYQATFDRQYLMQAKNLLDILLDRFLDQEAGGFFFTTHGALDVILRKKDLYDGAIPSGNSVAFLMLLKLGRILALPKYEEVAAKLSHHFSGMVRRAPRGFTFFLQGLEFALNPTYELVIVGKGSDPKTQEMISAYREYFLPNIVVILKDLEADASVSEIVAFTEKMSPKQNNPTAYVCKNYQCELPTTNVKKMLEFLNVKAD